MNDDDDELIEVGCACPCGYVLRVTAENVGRIARATELRYGKTDCVFDISKVPADVDLTRPVDAATIRGVVALCVRPADSHVANPHRAPD